MCGYRTGRDAGVAYNARASRSSGITRRPIKRHVGEKYERRLPGYLHRAGFTLNLTPRPTSSHQARRGRRICAKRANTDRRQKMCQEKEKIEAGAGLSEDWTGARTRACGFRQQQLSLDTVLLSASARNGDFTCFAAVRCLSSLECSIDRCVLP